MGHVVARFWVKKAWCVPFTARKVLFFVEKLEEASLLQDLGFFRVKGGYIALVRRWSPRANMMALCKFRRG